MSKENVRFAEALCAGAAGSDKAALLAALPEIIRQTCDPEIEWVEDPQRADSATRRGHAGVLESFERWLDGFDEYSVVADEFIDCGEDVLVIAREQGRGRTSRADVAADIYAVLTIRDGKLRRFREFYDKSQAFTSVGLEA